jgi:prefoldin subunit 5
METTKQPFNVQMYFGTQVNEITKSIEKLENDLQALYALKQAFEHELTIIESRSPQSE